MKKKQVSLLLAAAMIALSAASCGSQDTTPSKEEGPEPIVSDSETAQEEEMETESEENTETPDGENAADTDNDTDVTTENSTQTNAAVSPVSVIFQETYDEIKADDGKVIVESSASMPVIAIEGAPEATDKINADIETYYAGTSTADEQLVEFAKEGYAYSIEDGNGESFIAYTQDISADVTRMDDKVLSLKITVGEYSGGAHANYGSICKNYDVKTGEPILFENLTDDYEAFHATALDYIVNLAQTPTYKQLLFELSKNDLDDALFGPDTWCFTQSGITFLADPYMLGPYSSGEIFFTLPYEKAVELGLKESYQYDGPFVLERYYTTQYDPDTMETKADGTPEYSFDLNGDGTEEGIAFYGYVYPTDGDTGKDSFYIDGTDWGDVVKEALGDATSKGYLESTYALYDRDPEDGLTEVAILYTEIGEAGAVGERTVNHPYTYLFQYTTDKEFTFMERLDGYVTKPNVQK